MHSDDRVELEQLQAAVMATRFPVLFVGLSMGLSALVVMGLLGMTCFMFYQESGNDFLIAAALYAVLVVLYGAMGGILLASGIAGLRARSDEALISRIASYQLLFWRMAVLPTLAMAVLGTLAMCGVL